MNNIKSLFGYANMIIIYFGESKHLKKQIQPEEQIHNHGHCNCDYSSDCSTTAYWTRIPNSTFSYFY